MNYFKLNAQAFSFREGQQPNQGLRRGQVGALHALAAHFLEREDPAIVSLPTGYGKTAAMAGTCFLAEASRVLIIVPTSALRTQTAKAFRSLDTLRRLNALPGTEALGSPVVATVDERITTPQGWEALAGADVVIATPHSASTEIEGVVAPPEGFFDLVLIDEGHHSPARTWSAFIHQTPHARHVLYSATPFRKDRLQLPGRLVFYYTLKRAVEERAFGRVIFAPVTIQDGDDREQRDSALIQKALEIFNRDKANGFDHRLLIRTDKVVNAERLAELYVQAGLHVEAVSSRLSKAAVSAIEQRLRNGQIDGVVCVDMFGEGYDFPKFKIAVLHVPHRSLVPTLQFIGRFARTNDELTGDATFIAIPSDVNAESDDLYREGVDWDLLLADVAHARQQLAIRERETLQSFEETAHPSADYEAVNPGQFRLPQHIAAYCTGQPPNFSEPPETLNSLQVTNAWLSEDNCAYLLLTKEVKAPVWSRGQHLSDSRHDCFLLKYYADTGIVFITATQRTERHYSEIIEQFFGGNASPLAFERVRKVLNGLQGQEFFSIGLRNTSPTATTETYRIVAGSQADRGVRDSDAAYFCQGHFFGRGEVDGESEIIGASSGGRVWSNGKISVPDLLEWMDTLHGRIAAVAVNIGRSGLDRLPFGETLDRIPANTVTADWSKESYRDNPTAIWRFDDGVRRSCVLDLEISSISVMADGSSLTFLVGDEDCSRQLRYRPHHVPRYLLVGDGPTLLIEVKDGEKISVEEWFEHSPLTFYTADLDSFSSATLNRRSANTTFDIQAVQPHDWNGCEIGIEFDYQNPERRTVQRHLRDQILALPDLEFVIYDHRSGEAADFIVGQTLPGGRLGVSLYHCKGAGGQPSGERVDDVYELVGQSVKSVRYQRKETLLDHMERRTLVKDNGRYSRFLSGDRDATLLAVRNRQPIDIQLNVIAVQPGLSAAVLADRVKAIMAAANDSVASQQSRLMWMTSA